MRTFLSVILLAVVASTPAQAADTPASCGGVVLKRLAFNQARTKLKLTGNLLAGPGIPDVSGGLPGNLTLSLAYEPEADPAGELLSVTLPAASFTAVDRGVRYKDSTGAVGGIQMVKIGTLDSKHGTRKIVVKYKGAALDADHAGNLRATVSTTGGCARTCPSVCTLSTTNRIKCARSTDSALCGVKSGCEVLNVTDGQYDNRSCMLPYPSNFYTRTDDGTPTGLRLEYPQQVLPANVSGVHMDPTPYEVMDGFSPGTVGTVYWPQGVDLVASNIPPLTDWPASVHPDSPTLLIEVDGGTTCRRVEHFGENDVSLDNTALPVVAPNQAFMIRPGRRLKNGTRYILAMRNLVGQNGLPIEPSTTFKALRDGTPSGSAAVEARRAHFEGIFDHLESACGVPRGTLTLAWDFTTASDDAITRWLLHMRDETFAALPGSAAPAFVVNTVQDDPFSDPRVCRLIDGTFTAPLYTTFDGPGSVLNINTVTNLPEQNGTAQIPFRAFIPCSLISPTPTPGRPIFYGHGLLGSRTEVTAGHARTLANNYGFVMAATDWQGFSSADTATVLGFIGDLSGFPKLSERLHQGVLNQLLLGRLMKSPSGFASHPAFQEASQPLIDTSDVFWYGISQGGIEGGVVMALSQDATRGVLGVPAANYSTLLHRSRDFEVYFQFLRNGYPDAVARVLTLSLIQQLWDKSEPNGWYHHTLPGSLPDTPPHKVLVHMATSDDEVANLGTEIMVRSMGGVRLVSPPVRTYYGIGNQGAPFDWSALVESDGHYGPVPLTNVPPADNNAHGDMRARPAIQAQIDQFLRTGGNVQNFCAGPCDPE